MIRIKCSPSGISKLILRFSLQTPDHLRDSEKLMHGLQIWVALPKEKLKAQEFDKIPGDEEEFVPYPTLTKK